MHSSLPKALHSLAGKPMIQYALKNAAALSSEPPVVVLGYGAEAVRETVGEGARFVDQEQQPGMAHAVQMAAPLLQGKANLVLVISADTPLLRAETLQRLVEVQQSNPGPLSLLSVMGGQPGDLGQIMRGTDGQILAVVEQDHASPERVDNAEWNAGAICVSSDWLWNALPRLPASPSGE